MLVFKTKTPKIGDMRGAYILLCKNNEIVLHPAVLHLKGTYSQHRPRNLLNYLLDFRPALAFHLPHTDDHLVSGTRLIVGCREGS